MPLDAKARAAIDEARDKLAVFLHAKPGEIIFNSGANRVMQPRCARPGEILALRAGGHIISNKAETSCGAERGRTP